MNRCASLSISQGLLINTYTCITDAGFSNWSRRLKTMQAHFPVMWPPISSRAPRRLTWLSLLGGLVHHCCLLNLQFLTCALWVDNNNNGMIHFNWQCSTWNKMMFCNWYSILWLPLIEKVNKCSINFKFASWVWKSSATQASVEGKTDAQRDHGHFFQRLRKLLFSDTIMSWRCNAGHCWSVVKSLFKREDSKRLIVF